MQRKKLTIGLIGFGCVGYGLYEVLNKTKGLETTIKAIVVKNRDKKRQISQDNFSYDVNVILEDPEINVVVELIDDSEAAFLYVSEALKKGKAVVSANKKMIAEHFEELLELQNTYNAPLLYEAACCASIPIIRNLEEYYNNDLLESIEGIVNGSCNYILSRIFAEGLDYETALKQAQELGYAESNPILDTGGFDSAYKLRLLLIHAFGLVLKEEQIFISGIDRLGEAELNYAREKNLKIKLVASAGRNSEGKIVAYVLPKFVKVGEKLHTVDDVFNGVITKTVFADEQFFAGKGAGAFPTASAVLSDLSALTYDYRYEYKKLTQKEQLADPENVFLKVLLKHGSSRQNDYQVLFTDIEEKYSNRDFTYTVGVISLRNLEFIHDLDKENSFILFETIEQENTIKTSKELTYELTE